MTEANLKRLYKHYCTLADGKFDERTFEFRLKSKDPQEDGRSYVGKLPGARRELIQSDARRNKEEIESKYPFLLEKPKEDKKPKGGK